MDLKATVVRACALAQLVLILQLSSFAVRIRSSEASACKNHATCRMPYIVILDAGSTGTTPYVYRFERDDSLKLSVRLLSEKVGPRAEPGLGTFQFAPERIPAYLKPLIDFAKAQIPTEDHAEAMIFIGATAGLRNLPYLQRYAVVRKAGEALIKSPFRSVYNFQKGGMKQMLPNQLVLVMTGETEGSLALYSVNLLLGTYESKSQSSFGLIDLGGQSVQIVINNQPYIKGMVSIPPHVDYQQSVLGLGLSAASLDILTAVQPSPCLSPSYSGVFSFADKSLSVAGDPKTTGKNRWQACSALADAELAKFNVRPAPPQGSIAPFFTLGALYHAPRTLGKLGHLRRPIPGNVTVGDLVAAAAKSCADPPSKGKFEPYLCLQGAYISRLLTAGFKLRQDQVLYVANKVNGFTLGWTAGMGALQVAYPDILGNTAVLGRGYFEGRKVGDPED